jgi:hypothetical protein
MFSPRDQEAQRVDTWLEGEKRRVAWQSGHTSIRSDWSWSRLKKQKGHEWARTLGNHWKRVVKEYTRTRMEPSYCWSANDGQFSERKIRGRRIDSGWLTTLATPERRNEDENTICVPYHTILPRIIYRQKLTSTNPATFVFYTAVYYLGLYIAEADRYEFDDRESNFTANVVMKGDS